MTDLLIIVVLLETLTVFALLAYRQVPSNEQYVRKPEARPVASPLRPRSTAPTASPIAWTGPMPAARNAAELVKP